MANIKAVVKNAVLENRKLEEERKQNEDRCNQIMSWWNESLSGRIINAIVTSFEKMSDEEFMKHSTVEGTRLTYYYCFETRYRVDSYGLGAQAIENYHLWWFSEICKSLYMARMEGLRVMGCEEEETPSAWNTCISHAYNGDIKNLVSTVSKALREALEADVVSLYLYGGDENSNYFALKIVFAENSEEVKKD